MLLKLSGTFLLSCLFLCRGISELCWEVRDRGGKGTVVALLAKAPARKNHQTGNSAFSLFIQPHPPLQNLKGQWNLTQWTHDWWMHVKGVCCRSWIFCTLFDSRRENLTLLLKQTRMKKAKPGALLVWIPSMKTCFYINFIWCWEGLHWDGYCWIPRGERNRLQ